MKWLHFILSHSIFIAICAAALSFQTAQLLHYSVSWAVYGFIFFATLCSYNFYWIISKYSLSGKHSFSSLLQQDKIAAVILAVSAAGTVLSFFKSSLNLPYVLTAMALTIFYAIPLLPFKFLHFTRKAGVLKTIVLAFAWTYVTAFLPLDKSPELLTGADIFIMSRRFLFMLMLCIIFDNRDKAVDKIRGLHSLATDLGSQQLLLLIAVIFVILFGTNFLCVTYGISFAQSIALQTSTIALLIVYFFSTRKQGYLFYYFIVDGLMLFSALTTFIAGI
jgi:4-hydroxybenzoate polyprenyltransferase